MKTPADPDRLRRIGRPSHVCRLVAVALIVFGADPALSQTSPDPKAEFLEALGQFGLGLSGTHGDEGRSIASSLDSMAEALSRWDTFIQSRERAMAAEIGAAAPGLGARMRLALGGLYLDRVRVADALRELAAARSSDPMRPEVPLLQGLAHRQVTGDAAAATKALQEAHALAPQDPTWTYLLARQLLEGNQREAGLALLERVRHDSSQGSASGNASPFIRLDLVRETPGISPFFPPVLYADGFAALQRGDLANAIARFRESAKRDPLMAPGTATETESLARAATAFRSGLVDEARQQLARVLAQSPDKAEAHRILAMVDLADGQTERGIAGLRTAALFNPNDERTRLALASALLESQQLDEAEQALLDALKTIPGSGRAHYLLGLTYQRQGKPIDALRELQAARALKPLLGVNTIDQMIGTLQQGEQDLESAARSFAARADLVPNDRQAHLDLGKVFFLQGEDVQARAEFEIALLLNPSDAEAHTSLGQIHLRGARYEEAADASRRALEIDAGHREARYVHATALLRMGRQDEGSAELQVFQRLQAEDAAARARAFELGRLRREATVSLAAGDHANAVTLLQRALVLEPTAAASHLDLGVALLENGQAAAAVDRLNTAAALNAPLDVHRHLARAYAVLGRKDESQKEQAAYEQLKRESISKTGGAR
jgi:tetratricopeptide (TPR) repeat protein